MSLPLQTCLGGQCICSKGSEPCRFLVQPKSPPLLIQSNPAANILDNKVGVNFLPPQSTFGDCSSLLNPEVAKATAEAGGILQPQPCKPVFPAPWAPGSSSMLLEGMPSLNHTSILMCAYQGEVTFIDPGQTITMVK